MCGIGVAIDIADRGRARPWALPLMRHRGPDDSGLLSAGDGQINLEHCRLAIIDPENPEAAQPFTDPSGRWVLLYNGEVFNFRQLRRELERHGARFRTDSDTEVVLQSFIAHGTRAFRQFRGMFALVIWDRETGEVTAARDHLGVKPLYYTFEDGLFVAASEMRTLLGHPDIDPRLAPEAVVEYLASGHVGGEHTLLKGVRKLPPGHSLLVQGDRLRIDEYWDALPEAEDSLLSGPLETVLLDLLDEAVAAALVSDVPISLMLSGGLDSSTIAALATRHVNAAELTAYSVSFGLPTDESQAAARLAKDLGMRHRELMLTENELAHSFDSWLEHMDVPSADPTWIAVSHIARSVHDDGIKVLLSGDGGDELFGGYSRWMKYLRFHDHVWRRTPRSVRRLAGATARPLLRGLAGDIARRASESGELFIGSRPFHDDDLDRCLGPAGREAADQHDPEQSVRDLHSRFDSRFPDGDYLARMSYVALKTHLVEDYLARLDKLGMRHSVEGRVPLLDPVLASWAFRVSQEQKVAGYEQKALFRNAVKGLLPDYILERPKQGFCPPVADWARSLLAERLTADSILMDEGLVRPDAVTRLRHDGSEGGSFALWTLGTLMLWCDRQLN